VAPGRRADEHEDEGDDEGDQQPEEVEPGVLLLLLAAAHLAHGGAECRRRRRASSEVCSGWKQAGGLLLWLGFPFLSTVAAVMNDPCL
jgi:hypothetical protein